MALSWSGKTARSILCYGFGSAALIGFSTQPRYVTDEAREWPAWRGRRRLSRAGDVIALPRHRCRPGANSPSVRGRGDRGGRDAARCQGLRPQDARLQVGRDVQGPRGVLAWGGTWRPRSARPGPRGPGRDG